MKTGKLKGFKTKSLQSLQASLTLLSTLHVNTTSTKSISINLSKSIFLLVLGSTPAPEHKWLLGAVTAKKKKLIQTRKEGKIKLGR